MNKEIEDKDLELELKENELPEPEPELEIEARADPEPVVEEDKPEEGISLEKGIAELKLQLEKERNARFDAEKKAQEASQKADRAISEVEETNLQLVSTAIETVKRETAFLKNELKDSWRAGDFDRAAEIQELMATNAAKIMQLESGKANLENRPRETRAPSNDPVEAFAAQLSPRSADWVRNNPQCVTDPRMNQKMIAAHNMAMADGFRADTDEYFEYIEETLKLRRKEEKKEAEAAPSEPTTPARRPASPAAAPVSRTSTNTPRQNVVRLTPAEREMASMMGMTNEEYARNKLQLVKEGKLPN